MPKSSALGFLALCGGLVAMAITAACSSAPPASDLDLADKPPEAAAKNGRGSSGKMEPIEAESGGGKGLPTEPPTTPSEPASSDVKDGGTTTTTPPPPPPEYPFRAIDVRHPVAAEVFITQCKPDGATQLVWKTTGSGPDPDSSWANPQYTQQPGVYGGCGTKTANEYPIVLTSLAAGDLPNGSFIAKCTKTKEAHVYQITGTFEGHPMATFQYPESHAACP
jgi:hypothetical protein